MNELNSFIALSGDFEETLRELKDEFLRVRFVEFIRDSFVVDDAKSVVKEAYISETKIKVIFLGAASFNLYAQNSLLKILEEPPKNVVFIVCVPSKATLLPTIRSRLPIKSYSKKMPLSPSGLDIERLSVKEVYEFCQEHKYASKHELENLVQAIINEALKSRLEFSANELDTFGKLLHLVSLNSKAHTILPTLLSIILHKALS